MLSEIHLNISGKMNARPREEQIIEDISNKHILHNDFTEQNLENLLDSIISILEKARTELTENDFTINYLDYGFSLDDDSELDESYLGDFFEQAARFVSLHQKILHYTSLTYDEKNDEHFWIDSEHQAGTEAIHPLAITDSKYILNYIDFLRSNDMDHEVCQYDDINSVIQSHGWCEQTLQLSLARLFSCCGQHGREQFSELFASGLGEYIVEHFDSFLLLLAEENDYRRITDLHFDDLWQPGEMEDEWLDELVIVLDSDLTEELKTSLQMMLV